MDFKASIEENRADAVWIKKVDQVLRETFPPDELIAFATHFNIDFKNWEGLDDDAIAQKLDKFSEMTDTIDIGSEKFMDILALRPFGDIMKKQNALQVYESFCKKRLAFDMGMTSLTKM